MKKWIICILLLLVFIFSVLSGFLVRSFINFSKKDNDEGYAILAEKNETQENVVKTNSSEITVSPNAEVVITQTFKKCGHTIVKRETVPREIVNLKKEDVEKFYKDWNIDEFTANEIKISKTNSGICGEHYIIRESDGYISISCKNDIGEYIFKALTDIPVQYLPEEDVKKLEKGIEIVGRDNLNKFLEDYE